MTGAPVAARGSASPPASSHRGRPGPLPGSAAPIAAGLSLLAAVAAAVATALDPFDHGVWLVAYLFLVGSLAQLLLDRGRAALVRAHGARRQASTPAVQVTLWNIGVIAVPAGVLADTRLTVVAGSLSLLVALYLYATEIPKLQGDGTGARKRPGLATAHRALIGFMIASVVVGAALAWNIPWY